MSVSVVHFSTADGEGGSARSAYRIHTGLRRRGHRSRMLVGYKVLDDDDIDTVSGGETLRRCDSIADRVTWRLGLQYQLVPSAVRVMNHPWLRSPDVIQLFNTHGGYLATRMLPALAARAHLVWRLSDMWPLTGHCAYAGPCMRWRSGCGSCPDLGSYPAIGIDTTAWLWRQKRRLYNRMRLTIVAPSSWIENLARQSPLLAQAHIHRIPNGLDLKEFRSCDQAAARMHFQIPQGATVLLFAPHVASENKRKGGDLLEAALRRLGDRKDLVLLVAGVGAEQWVGRVPVKVVPLGYLKDQAQMAIANSAADVVVVPSAVDNLPNGVLEAFACGRPVVAFDSGGMGDAVRDGETGLLVASGNIEALSSAIERIVADRDLLRSMGDRALELAQREFSADVEISRFEALYATLMDQRHHR